MGHIAVVGAGGRLGIQIANIASISGETVTAVASTPSVEWAPGVVHQPAARENPPENLRDLFASADVVIVAAPLNNPDLHTIALQAECHLVDVTISIPQIRSVLALREQARRAGRSVVTAAGLAPGLTGLLGRDLHAGNPNADQVHVCLTQNAKGSAGEHGTREMLDMLTEHGSSTTCCLTDGAVEPPRLSSVFRLPTPETAFVPENRVEYFTRFDSTRVNRSIGMLSGIRAAAPRLYRRLRDQTAKRKARAGQPIHEECQHR